MSAIRTIAKNTTALFSTQIIGYILLFFASIYMARYLGTEDFGILSLAIALTSIFFIFTDFGLNTLIVREVSRDKSLYNNFFLNSVIIKCLLAIITMFITYLTVIVLNYPFDVASVIYIVMLSVIFNSFTGVINSIFQAYEKMEYQSISNILNGIVLLGFVLLAIQNSLDLIFFAEIYLISSVIILIYSVLVYLLEFKVSRTEISTEFWKETMMEAWPFGLNSLFALVFVWIDSLFLSLIVGNVPVGIYNAAYRVITFLLFIPIIFNTVIFPVMSRFYSTSKSSLFKTLEKYFKLILIIAIPIGVVMSILSDVIILILFGSDFIESIIVLQILIWAAVLIFVNSPFVQLIQAINKQLTLTKITAICMVENIVLNLILIPRFSYVGASIVTVITEFTVLILVYIVLTRIGYGIPKKQFINVFKIVIASLLIGILILCFRDWNLLILTPLTAIIYLVIIFLIRVIDDEDVYLLKKLIHRGNSE